MCIKVKSSPTHQVYFSQEEALPHISDKEQVGIGYILAHNVYRISESKDKEGNPQKIFNFLYHYI